MNYSPLAQFFMVYNTSHSIYSALSVSEKIDMLNFIIPEYIKDRHYIYKSHGYSNIVLQVLSDNYSHKRKGKIGIEKIEMQLQKHLLKRLKKFDSPNIAQNNYYILPDKGDKKVFKEILETFKIDYNFSKQEQDKIPDVLIKIGNEFYIIEQKNMKENGGGQDKQIVEVLSFINYQERNKNVHYITYLDGLFSNKLIEEARAKNKRQYNYILKVFKNHPNNFFVNTFAFEELLNEICKKTT